MAVSISVVDLRDRMADWGLPSITRGSYCTSLGRGRDQNSKFEVGFLQNASLFLTIIKSKNPKSETVSNQLNFKENPGCLQSRFLVLWLVDFKVFCQILNLLYVTLGEAFCQPALILIT